jgi:hypothetical protein
MRDWLAFQWGKTGQRLSRLRSGGPRVRPHRALLSAAVSEVLRVFPDPVCLETGCVRSETEGTDSTLAIATALGGRGRFFTFELAPRAIETCRVVCRAVLDRIRIVEGDAKVNLARLRGEGALKVVHLAFLDSADDPGQIWAEFQAIEPLFVPGSLLIVDDAIRGVKARRVAPYLRASATWETRLVYAGNGLLLAVRR